MTWYGQITAEPDNYQLILDAYDHFEQELEDARKECWISGSVEKMSANLPGDVEYRFAQLQEIEAILEHLNIKYRKSKNEKFRHFLEHYNKAMSSKDAEKYAEIDDEVIVLAEILNRISFIRNRYLGIMKGLENKAFQINNITRLRCAGLEDAEISYGRKY